MQGGTEECGRIGNRIKGAEEQQVPHAPAPSAGFVPASSLQQFKSSLHKLDPWGEGRDQRAANYCHSEWFLPGKEGTLDTQGAQADELATRDQMFLYCVAYPP